MEYKQNKKSQDTLTEQISTLFFSKDKITEINKTLLSNFGNYNLNREVKEQIITIIVKNMKLVFRKLNLSQITNSNIKTIYDQFRKVVIDISLQEIKKSKIIESALPDTTNLKFQRDFKSNPNTGNKLMDRPEQTKQTRNNEQHLDKTSKNNFDGFSNNMYESNFDNAFKPIVDNLSDKDIFNNYDTGRS
jgi:hypothetical protein